MAQRMIGERQRWAWLAAGFSAVAAAGACGLGWLWVLLGSGTAALYYIYMDSKLTAAGGAQLLSDNLGWFGRILAAGILLWTMLLLGWTANLADAAFPMVEGFPVLGLVMLTLTAWSSTKGPAACARCAGVLCLFLAVLYGLVAVFAAPNVKLRFLLPQQPWENSLWAVGLFLLPAAVWFVPCRCRQKRPAGKLLVLLPCGAAMLALITDGVLSPQLAQQQTAPLYAVAQSVSIFGVLERIEPLVSAAITMGVFCLLSSMACACTALGNQLAEYDHWSTMSCVIGALLLWPATKLGIEVITAGTVVCYLMFPLTAAAVGKIKEKMPRRSSF